MIPTRSLQFGKKMVKYAGESQTMEKTIRIGASEQHNVH